MAIINNTFTLNEGVITKQYIPSDQCFDWCIEQQVVHSNNLELWSVMFVFAAYIFILLHSLDDIEFIQKYQKEFMYMAKLMLIAFFVSYILIIRLRVIY